MMYPQFDGKNFASWKFRVMLLLQERNLSEHVLNEPLAAELSDAAWKLEDVKARSLLVKCLADSYLEYVRLQTTASAMWKALCDVFEKKGAVTEMYLRKRLLSLKFKDGDSMERHLSMFDSIVNELRGAGADVRDPEAVSHLLLSLPQSYESVVTALETVDPGSLTVTRVKARLISEELKRSERDSSWNQQDQNQAAFLGKTKRFMGRCWKCKQTGHKANQCNFSDEGGKGENSGATSGTRKVFQLRRRDASPKDDPGGAFAFCTGGSLGKAAVDPKARNIRWIVDSGCTDHMVSEDTFFLVQKTLETPYPVSLAEENQAIVVTKAGFISCVSHVEEKEYRCDISDVLYAPGLRHNLLSVSRLEKSGFTVIFRNGEVEFWSGNILFAVGSRCQDLYEVSFEMNVGEINAAQGQAVAKNLLWHRRFGHLGMRNVCDLANSKMVNGIDFSVTDSLGLCEACIMGKHFRCPFGTRTTRASRPLERVHTDVCGPITPSTWDGKRYFLTFIDDCTHFTIAFLIASRDEVLQCFKEYKAMVEAGFGLKLSRLRCDNGGEYVSKEMRNLCRQTGVILEYTMAYTPEQNGIAERMNRTLVEKARAMIFESGFDKEMWGEAVMSAVFVTNRSPTAALQGKVTPAEAWFGQKPDVSGLRVFGCKAYSHVPKQKRGKFDQKSEVRIMVGYTINGYRLWDPITRTVHLSRDVIFDENVFPASSRKVDNGDSGFEIRPKADETMMNTELVADAVPDDPGADIEQADRSETSSIGEFHTLVEDEEQNQSDGWTIQDERSMTDIGTEDLDLDGDPLDLNRRSGRIRRAPVWLQDYETEASAMLVDTGDDGSPLSYKNIKGREDEECWMNAVQEELDSLEANETWDVVEQPPDVKIVTSKWIFKKKLDKDGNLDRYKARVVARGFMQQEGVDFHETYAPVAKLATIRFLLAVGIQFDYQFCHMDVITAFLHGNLEQPVYMKPPEGVRIGDGKVLKLKKSLYGLRQSPKCWNNRFHQFVTSLGFKRSEADYCLYVKKDQNGTIYLLLYVDDLLICGDSETAIQELKSRLLAEFRMKDLGNLEYFMGMKIKVDRELGRVAISQSTFAESILRRFNMQSCNPVATPMEVGTKLSRPDTSVEGIAEYRQLIGSLMYLMLGSRPDLCFSVSYFSRFQDCAQTVHWNYLKRVLRYLRGTASYELVYTRDANAQPLKGFVDSDWANDVDDRRSTSGFLFEVYGNTVSWTSRKQGLVALSTTEAEYVAAASAVSEALWLKKLFSDIEVPLKHATPILEDNQGCLFMAKNPETKRSKHVDVKYHMVRDNVWKKEVDLVYVPSQEQVADVLTKPLSRSQFEKLCRKMGLERGGV